MKYAVRFYTKTGNTKHLAEAVARFEPTADMSKIEDCIKSLL